MREIADPQTPPTIHELSGYLDRELACGDFRDYCPNGLQVEGDRPVRRLVAAVSACQEAIDAAVAREADVLLVHHGFFWKGEDPCLVGVRRRRIKALLDHGISLLAYHLPLDAHPEWGNNAVLARALGWNVEAGFGGTPPIALEGSLPETGSASGLAADIGRALGREPLLIAAGDRPVRRIGWCTGAAQELIEEAARRGLDAFVSGEISERTVYMARENGIHYIAAGHHATERGGVQALAAHLQQRFGIETDYVEVDNPV